MIIDLNDFVEKYVENVETKIYNANYERPAIRELLGEKLDEFTILDAGCSACLGRVLKWFW